MHKCAQLLTPKCHPNPWCTAEAIHTTIAQLGAAMKATIEIPEALLDAAKALAKQNRTTLRAAEEEGLGRVLSD
jgi:hypothetical protein